MTSIPASHMDNIFACIENRRTVETREIERVRGTIDTISCVDVLTDAAIAIRFVA